MMDKDSRKTSVREKYRDIINLPHHVSGTRPQMPVRDRAAQFSPFSALTGYDDIINESGRAVDARHEFSEDELMELDIKQRYLLSIIDQHPEITVTCFVADEKKSGGSYAVKTGELVRIYDYERELGFSDGSRIRIDDIVDIQSQVFEGMGE